MFKPIKNAIIRAVLDLNLTENEQAQNNIQSAVSDILKIFGNLISEDYNRSLQGQKLRTEHKLKNAIRRKKQALGMKESPLENPVFKV